MKVLWGFQWLQIIQLLFVTFGKRKVLRIDYWNSFGRTNCIIIHNKNYVGFEKYLIYVFQRSRKHVDLYFLAIQNLAQLQKGKRVNNCPEDVC